MLAARDRRQLTAMLVLAAPAGAAVKRLEANLTGAAETAPGGDPNGSGTASCGSTGPRSASASTGPRGDIYYVVAAHIHAGGRGVAGSIAVDLIAAPESGNRFTGCAYVTPVKSLIRKIGVRRPRSTT